MQLPDECVQCRARALSDYLDTSTVGEIPNVAAKAQPLTYAGDEEAESDALHAATDGCVELLAACGCVFHFRAASPVQARRAEVRDGGVRRPAA